MPSQFAPPVLDRGYSAISTADRMSRSPSPEAAAAVAALGSGAEDEASYEDDVNFGTMDAEG